MAETCKEFHKKKLFPRPHKYILCKVRLAFPSAQNRFSQVYSENLVTSNTLYHLKQEGSSEFSSIDKANNLANVQRKDVTYCSVGHVGVID